MRLELKGAGRSWGKSVALREVDVVIGSGERVALLGPSGSGKTTLLRLVAGALRANHGEVLADGVNLDELSAARLRAHRQRSALLDQTSHCVEQLSVHSNVVAGLLPRWPWYRVVASTLWPLETERVKELLCALDLGDRQWDGADELSGGQRQRVAIARALAAGADLLLLDEPTAALDPETARAALAVIETRRAESQTLLLSTHRASEVLDHVDRVLGLRDGELVFDHRPGEITADMLASLYAGSRELA